MNAIEEEIESLVKGGLSPTLAEMFAHRQPPGCKTDREFLRGHCCGNQFEKNPEAGDFYAGVAKAHGADITGKVYLSSLAAFPGDPRAWVSGRGDVQKVCEERRWNCSGDVDVKHTVDVKDYPGQGCQAIAPDIVNAEVDRLVKADPGLAERTDRRELCEMVVDQHKGPNA